MKETFTFKDERGKEIYAVKWIPDQMPPVAIIQISHGMAEHIDRYDEFAGFLTEHGFVVYGHDHRGHGQTDPDQLGFVDTEDGFELQVNNIFDFRQIIEKEFPGLPRIMFGHSMGSFLLQRYFQIYDDQPAAIIYSGSSGPPPVHTSAGILLTGILKRIFGPQKKSTLIHNLMFKPFNKAFKPNRTDADWLSRDKDEVDKYINDPACGFVGSLSFYQHFLAGLKKLHKHQPFFKHPRSTPILLISGESDPVSDMGKGVTWLKNVLELDGAKGVGQKLYTGARHELLNEINKMEVMNDIISWIENKTSVKS